MELFPQEQQPQRQKKGPAQPPEETAREPLAHSIRPSSFTDFSGQGHIIGPGSSLRALIESDSLGSSIFTGPPGTGKSTLAHIISSMTKKAFVRLNAVTSNVAEVRQAIETAARLKSYSGRGTIVFIDEIHRFNKAQQDALMPSVESGTITLIGATTENPYFSVNSALLSRLTVYEFKKLAKEDIETIIQRAAMACPEPLVFEPSALSFLSSYCDGDARRAINVVQNMSFSRGAPGNKIVNVDRVKAAMQKQDVLYDRKGDEHYDTISAFIKSMRGSDPDASVYWLAKMLYAGEDPLFIARRILICASEDVGNADPWALVVAQSAFAAVDCIGMPEARIILSQAAVYVACAPKSNASYEAINKATSDIVDGKVLNVPGHLRDASYAGAKKLGRQEGYLYPHSFPGNYVQQAYTPEPVSYYHPSDNGYEKKIKERLAGLRRPR